MFPPAVGYYFSVLINLYRNNKVQGKYYLRLFMLGAINLINKPFRFYERYFINPQFKETIIENSPVFILGYWRSGTTYLHNLLCKNPDTAYITTYQSVFPNTLFGKAGRFLFLSFMKLLIPKTRKADNVKLSSEFPQEEGFIVGNKVPICYYYFWYFPQNAARFYREAIEFKGVSDKLVAAWEEDYTLLIKKAVKNTKGKYFVSKNPPNTGRIKQLLEMFPDAKFVHIYRSPIIVFLSTRHFFKTVLPSLQLQEISDNELDELIFKVYNKMMHSYLEDKKLIPKENLIEIRFEDMEKQPMDTVEAIYKELRLLGFEEHRNLFEQYTESKKGYTKNSYEISRKILDRILAEWDFTMKECAFNQCDEAGLCALVIK